MQLPGYLTDCHIPTLERTALDQHLGMFLLGIVLGQQLLNFS